MEADDRHRLAFQRAILTILLIAGCVTCLMGILPASGL